MTISVPQEHLGSAVVWVVSRLGESPLRWPGGVLEMSAVIGE